MDQCISSYCQAPCTKSPERRQPHHPNASPTPRLTKKYTPLAKPPTAQKQHCSDTSPRLRHSRVRPHTVQPRYTKLPTHQIPSRNSRPGSRTARASAPSPDPHHPGIEAANQPRCTKIPAHRCHSPSSDSSTARLTILCTHHEPHSQTPRTFRLHHPLSISHVQPRGIRVHKTPGSRTRWALMNPVWLRGDDSGTTYLCRSTSGFSTGLGEPGVAGMRNGEFPADPRLGAGENRLAL